MIPEWLHLIAIIYLAGSVLCALGVLMDILSGHKQRMAIMNVVWPITVLYFGPIGLWAYWRMGRSRTARMPRMALERNHSGNPSLSVPRIAAQDAH